MLLLQNYDLVQVLSCGIRTVEGRMSKVKYPEQVSG